RAVGGGGSWSGICGNVGDAADQAYPALMLSAWITLLHFSVSSAMKLPKSAGDSANTVPPKSASRAFNFGSARPTLISLLSLSMTSTGVLFGAPTPYHALTSYPVTNSPTLGTSGTASARIALVTASPRF